MYWRLLRENRDFRLLYLGTLISLGGDWFLTVALLDLVLQLTGSATRAINAGPRAAAAGDRSIVVVWTTADEERELVATVFRSDGQLVTMTPEAVLASEHFADGEPVAGWDGTRRSRSWCTTSPANGRRRSA